MPVTTTPPGPTPDIATPYGPKILEPNPPDLPSIPEVPKPLTPDPARTEPDPTPAPPKESPATPPDPQGSCWNPDSLE